MSEGSSNERLLAIIATQNQIATSSLDLQRVMDLVAQQARTLVGAAASVVELSDGDELLYAAASGTAEAHLGTRIPAAGTLAGRCIATAAPLHCVDATRDERVDRAACERVGAISMMCVPLLHETQAVGVLQVHDPRPAAFREEDLASLELLAGVIASHMAHARDYLEQHRASMYDQLTGLLNRRAFDRRIAAEGARTRRYGDVGAICMLDLDGFRHVNDSYGHAAGDDVLRAVADHFRALRGEDEAYRFGGDEFAMVLIGAEPEDAAMVAERIAAAIADDETCRGVTASYGAVPLDGDDPLASVEHAEMELYDAKARRNPPDRSQETQD